MIKRMKITAAAAGFGLMALGLLPAAAQGSYHYGWDERTPVGHGQLAAPVVLGGPGLGIVSPYQQIGPNQYVHIPHYQGPDGGYDNLSDLSREVNGVPCGIGCQARALHRWGYTPAF